MGSLDAQFLHSNHSYNPLVFAGLTKSQDFQPGTAEHARPQVNPAGSYNPFANPPTSSRSCATRYDQTTSTSYDHPRYDPLSQQTLPPFSSTGYERPVTASYYDGYDVKTPHAENGYKVQPECHEFPNGYGCYDGFERPCTVHGYGDYPGYNPFSQEYEPVEHGDNSLVSYNYLPIRVHTPPSMRQYAHPLYPAHFPVQEEFPAASPHTDAVVPFDPQNGKSQRLLWLSEEEAEIIRLIRLSQMKENLRSSGFSLSEEQLSPDVSPQPGPELRASGQANEKGTSSSPSKSSNVSTTSIEEFCLPVAREPPVVRSKVTAKKEAPEGRSQKGTELNPEKMDTAKIVDDDREWIAIQRQKIKDVQARKQQNAAVCIQRRWREYRSRLKSRKAVNKKPTPVRQQPAKANNARRDRPRSQRFSVQEAAKVIQRAWRAAIRRRRLKSRDKLPKTLRGLYESIKFRHSSNGLKPPPYARFLKLLDRIHACTEGARIRKRLKSRRLQAIVKEIKEIRVLMEDMSTDTAPTSAELLAQLSGQLQQKIIQLHTALQGPGDAARYLLRRGPATPLVIYGSRSTSPTSRLQRTGDQVQIRVIGNAHTENGVPSVRCSLFTVNNSGASKDGGDGSANKSDARKVRLQKPETEVLVSRTLHHDDKPLKRHQEFKTKGEPDSRPVKPSSEVQRSGKTSQYFFIEKDIDSELPSKNENMVASKLSQYLVNSSNSSRHSKEPDDYGYESTRRTLDSIASDSEQQSDHERPKRPFLRRKSIAMAPQKLDWSKVKPMVSSRLEPELKTKLYRSKVREIARNASSKKMNYSNVKSRLFNYESQAVDTSGALSSDRSISIETDFEVPGRQGYAEIHTQVDMVCKEDCWRPASVASGTVPQEEPLPNYRYLEDTAGPDEEEGEEDLEVEEEEDETPSTPKSPPKAPSHRYERTRNSHAAARFESGSSALEEIDHNGELERKKQNQHSFRYKEAAGLPEASVSVKEPATTKRDRNGGKKEKDAEHVSSKTDVEDNSRTIEASPELEATFKHVMSIKGGCNMSVFNLFGAPQQTKSIVPRVFPNASIFNSSFSEKRRLHELLIQEGRASKLQHDSLAFVSIRD